VRERRRCGRRSISGLSAQQAAHTALEMQFSAPRALASPCVQRAAPRSRRSASRHAPQPQASLHSASERAPGANACAQRPAQTRTTRAGGGHTSEASPPREILTVH
jgi:hypothetical protein